MGSFNLSSVYTNYPLNDIVHFRPTQYLKNMNYVSTYIKYGNGLKYIGLYYDIGGSLTDNYFSIC